MGRVFVVQEPLKRVGDSVKPRIDYDTLTPYGEIKFLFEWSELKDDDVLENTAALIWKLRASLHNFTDEDYIVCLGNPALIGMAVTVAAECNNGSVNILDWIRERRRYRVVTMDLHCQPERVA
jgi:hypothetical protein